MAGTILRGVLEQTQGIMQRTFAVEHRLASAAPFTPANPFPAAIIDVLAGYRHLIETIGFKPENIVVSGGSSGGHIAVNVVRYSPRQTSLPFHLQDR